jgi:DNA-binding CsgD family transcriptional regulator
VSNRILTEAAVKTIRKAARVRKSLSNRSLAERFGVSEWTVRNVLKGSRWGHVK